jgi:hypothetical protein
MMEKAQQMEKLEADLDALIDSAHKSGTNYWEILRAFLNICQRLMMMADAEYFAKRQQGGKART